MKRRQRLQIDLSAPIEPGMSAARIALCERAEALPPPLRKLALSPDGTLFEYSGVSVWVRHESVCQICVNQGYSGMLAEGIGIGSSVADVERLIGSVEEDVYDNLIVIGYPGWCFETEEWLGRRIKDNQQARINSICVFKSDSSEH